MILNISLHVNIFRDTCIVIFRYSIILYISAFWFFLLAFSMFNVYLERGVPLNSFEPCIIYLEVILIMWQTNIFEEKQRPHFSSLNMLWGLSFNISLGVGKFEKKETLRITVLPCAQLHYEGTEPEIITVTKAGAALWYLLSRYRTIAS